MTPNTEHAAVDAWVTPQLLSLAALSDSAGTPGDSSTDGFGGNNAFPQSS